MDTVIVSNSQFYSHFPRQIPKGSVNAEQVEIRLDKSWDGLTVFWHWKNLGTGVEKRDLLKDPAVPNTIPWEVLTDLGELRMGLVGLDGETVIKPTIWLTYGYVVDGVDPESGSDPQPPTPSWEQKMVEQATQANKAAQAAQKASEEAAKSAASAGPYAQAAADARDQANTAATAADTDKGAAEQAATTAGAAQSGAAQSAQAASNFAQAAERAKEEAQNAAAAFPAPSPEVAGMVPMVNPKGDGYIFGEAGGGELLLAEYIHQGNQEIQPASIDWESGVIECTEPHGLSEATEVFLVPNKSSNGSQIENIRDLPAEWVGYNGRIYLLPITETSAKVVGSDKTSPIPVNPDATNNANISVEKFHFEIGIVFSITNLDASPDNLRFEIITYSRYGKFTISLGTNSGLAYLTSQEFSPVTLYNNKAYHGYLYFLSIDVGIFDGMYSSWCHSSGLAKALSYARNAFWAEISIGPIQMTNADNKIINVVNSFSAVGGSNTLHNGGVVRIYGEREDK